MDERDRLFWLVGLLEGEGSFLVGPPSDPTRPRISIQMTDEDVIQQVAKLFGRTYYKCGNRSPNSWKDSYAVKVRGAKAVEIMRQIRPYMSARRKAQIDRALTCWPDKEGTLRSGEARASLTEHEVAAIRQRLQTTSVRLRELADEYDVSLHVMKDISAGRTWTHVQV